MGVPRDVALGPCGACGKAVHLSAVLYTADARLLCPICYTKADVLAARRRARFDGGGTALVGAIAAVVPMLLHGGLAMLAGAVAAVCGGSTVLAARARASAGWLLLGALVLALGAYQLAREAGLVG